MVQLITAGQMARATERAKASKLFVKPLQWRQYKVTNRETGAQYTVDFFVRNSKRFGHCTCKVGMNHQPCKHLSAAAGLHVMLAAQRRQSQKPNASA